MPDIVHVIDIVFVTVLCFWLVLFGACWGSFLNVLVYRLPRRESLITPPSHCPRCGHLIRWYDNVPVIGWFKLGGKCRDCRMPISFRYPCIEAISGVLAGSIFLWLYKLLSQSLEMLIVWTLLAMGVFSFLFVVLSILFTKNR